VTKKKAQKKSCGVLMAAAAFLIFASMPGFGQAASSSPSPSPTATPSPEKDEAQPTPTATPEPGNYFFPE